MAQMLLINILDGFTSDTLYHVKNDDLGEINTPQISQFHLFTSRHACESNKTREGGWLWRVVVMCKQCMNFIFW